MSSGIVNIVIGLAGPAALHDKFRPMPMLLRVRVQSIFDECGFRFAQLSDQWVPVGKAHFTGLGNIRDDFVETIYFGCNRLTIAILCEWRNAPIRNERTRTLLL